MAPLIDLLPLKQSAQKFAKCEDAVEKRCLGKSTVEEAHRVCSELLKTCSEPSSPPIEAACKALSYPLANAVKMDETSALELLHIFGSVLALKVV